jgi:hypothetical protein
MTPSTDDRPAELWPPVLMCLAVLAFAVWMAWDHLHEAAWPWGVLAGMATQMASDVYQRRAPAWHRWRRQRKREREDRTR